LETSTSSHMAQDSTNMRKILTWEKSIHQRLIHDNDGNQWTSSSHVAEKPLDAMNYLEMSLRIKVKCTCCLYTHFITLFHLSSLRPWVILYDFKWTCKFTKLYNFYLMDVLHINNVSVLYQTIRPTTCLWIGILRNSEWLESFNSL